MRWSTKDKSEALDITERHVLRLMQEGVLPKSDDPKQITRAYVRHLRESKGGKADLIEERTRLTRIQADRKELELKVAQGKLIDVDIAMSLWGMVVQAIRSKLLALPSKQAPLMLGCNSLSELQDVGEKQVNEVLEELGNPDLKKYSQMLGTHSANLPNAKASSKVKSKRMGRSKKSPKRGE